MSTLEGIKIGNEVYDFPKTDAYVKTESDAKYATKTEVSAKASSSYVNTELAKKQDTLTAGEGVTIENNVISANGSGVGDLPISNETTTELGSSIDVTEDGTNIFHLDKNGLKVPKLETNEIIQPSQNTTISVSSTDSVTIGNGVCCQFISGGSYKITGVGNATINVTFANKTFDNVSYAFWWNWESQKIAKLTAQGVLIDKFLATRPQYYIQGATFQRINKKSSATDAQFVITSSSAETWTLYITKQAERLAKSVKPICFIYDGASWRGKVLWEGAETLIWDLHKELNIPYSVAIDSTQIDSVNFCDEVKRDIASGLCETIVRNVNANTQATDAGYISTMNAERSAVMATCKATVLAQHILNPLLYRSIVKDNADFIRQYQFADNNGILANKFSDSPYRSIHNTFVNEGMNEENNFCLPQIYWAHGVGIPPEGTEYASYYIDTTGERTQVVFRQLLRLIASGKVVVLTPSNFATFCKNL